MRSLVCFLLFSVLLQAQTLQEKRWDAAVVLPHRFQAAENVVNRILRNRARYETVDQGTQVPWYVIAALHNMEASGDFSRHLHEGSSLTARTRYVPKGRPKTGTPPFTWEYSATDALQYDSMGKVDWASLDAMLYAAERYNGTGYLRFHPETPTPYLWSYTSVERPGKYVADGKWSSTARSSQVGCAAIWKVMETKGIIDSKRLRRSP